MTNIEPIYLSKARFGIGVFAKKFIKKGELICNMKGKEITEKEFDVLIKKGRTITVDPLQIGIDKYLDLEEPYVYFNHSCNPNSGLKNTTNLIAIKDIRKDEEIFFDYSTTWYDGFRCGCNSRNCRKHIADYYSIPLKVQEKYIKLGIIPDFILKN